MTNKEESQAGLLAREFERLFLKPVVAASISIRWAIGGGILLIDRQEWEKQPDWESKVAVVRTRLNNIWNEVQRKKL